MEENGIQPSIASARPPFLPPSLPPFEDTESASLSLLPPLSFPALPPSLLHLEDIVHGAPRPEVAIDVESVTNVFELEGGGGGREGGREGGKEGQKGYCR